MILDDQSQIALRGHSHGRTKPGARHVRERIDTVAPVNPDAPSRMTPRRWRHLAETLVAASLRCDSEEGERLDVLATECQRIAQLVALEAAALGIMDLHTAIIPQNPSTTYTVELTPAPGVDPNTALREAAKVLQGMVGLKLVGQLRGPEDGGKSNGH